MARELDEITGMIVDAAYKIHSGLGPGLLESVYEAVLASELERRGLRVKRQVLVPIEYEGMHFDEGFRIDLLVEDVVIVEIKSVEKSAPVHSKQILTYLRLMNLPVGLLVNFGAATLKEGLSRVVNNYNPSPSAPPRLRVNQNGPHEPSALRGDACIPELTRILTTTATRIFRVDVALDQP